MITLDMLTRKVLEVMNIALANSETLENIIKQVNVTNKNIADMLLVMIDKIELSLLQSASNGMRIDDLELIMYRMNDLIGSISKISINALGLGIINTVLIIILFVMIQRKKKCKCKKGCKSGR